MPTLLIWHGHKFRFYALDRGEPAHVHVVKGSLKVWLDPMEVARNVGYNDREIERVLAIIAEHREEWMEAWNGFFGI